MTDWKTFAKEVQFSYQMGVMTGRKQLGKEIMPGEAEWLKAELSKYAKLDI